MKEWDRPLSLSLSQSRLLEEELELSTFALSIWCIADAIVSATTIVTAAWLTASPLVGTKVNCVCVL